MPTMPGLAETARAIVADGKGILAADETVSTITKRLTAREIESTRDSRRAYREMLFSTPGIAAFIGGVILQDETIHQDSATGTPLVELLEGRGIIPGIKVDAGVRPLAGAPGESVTEGLDGLRERLVEYRELGARFAKWRAVFSIREGLPSAQCIHANAHALARYAALCQEQGLVPIVEPEVLMEGAHALERCEDVTGRVLHAVFNELFDARVSLEGMLLKPNMVTAGHGCARQAPVEEVAEATLRALTRHVPPAVPGVVFLSGGQDHVLATEHLNAINALEGPKPWTLSFSYGRALQDEALEVWRGRREQVPAAQQVFHHRAWCDSAAALGRYSGNMEDETGFAQAAEPPSIHGPSDSPLHTHH
ncbi:class I fructose-bisphosphate aldolase [Corallococcus carmarthensis]|uniref:Fructose-bisphosphate aldolase n=1 Tax=Corallococcus carmarthensis TaxID=2316728 RepID=A0A3A8KZN4_9BACT|nr:class I fructose-bisphosphate aldolase [Corallococcus carmarthensis]NOK15500.1 fructose-bisphosphate aldolase class I [Corallococcus carmarthensis]RKH07682.1 fructose-bisphosphate aldolase class I [Corallococcus carmarthensis]